MNVVAVENVNAKNAEVRKKYHANAVSANVKTNVCVVRQDKKKRKKEYSVAEKRRLVAQKENVHVEKIANVLIVNANSVPKRTNETC